MPKQKQPTIFVQIASYRDTECQWTIKDLYEKAAHPERVFVGICWQVTMPDDAECFKIPYPFPKQVRVNLLEAKDAKGANWARVQASKLWDGEEYVFFSEPHMRFVQNWDLHLLEMHENCESEKPVISWVHPTYSKPDKLDWPFIAGLAPHVFHTDDILYFRPTSVPDEMIPEKPFPNPVLVVSGLFAKSELLHEVPQDPHIYFYGDEASYSARVWTHGWDIFFANHPVTYHLADRSTRPLNWDDHPQKATERFKSSSERFKYLFGMQEEVSDLAKVEIEKYGMGTARTLKEYEEFAGLNFKERKIFNQDHWDYKRTPETVCRPAPLVIQKWRVKEHREWFAQCIADQADIKAVMQVCLERGISETVARAEYELVRQGL